MLNKIKKIFIKTEKSKHVVVCIHGFGIRTTHQYDNFKLWNTEFNLHTFDIFAKEEEEDCNPEIWIKRCESVVDSFIQANYKVDLVGFSMGGVIASHIASKYPIDHLFLIAPAFEYLTPTNVIHKTKEIFVKKEDTKPVLPASFTSCFIEVVKNCKDSIKKVSCPTCIVHGNKDEVVPYKSSINIIEQIPHNKKMLFIINKGTHHLMSDPSTGYETYQIFKLFMKDEIIRDNVAFAKDIYE